MVLFVCIPARKKCCKKCEMRSHFPHGSIICCMLWHDIVSLLYISQLILAMSVYQNTNQLLCFIAWCLASNHRHIVTIFYLFSVFWNEIFIVLCMQIFMLEKWRTRQTNFKRQFQDRIVHSSSICCYLSALASFKCRLYLCFCLLSHSLSPLQCQLETVGAHMQYQEKINKTKMSGGFFTLRKWQMKNRRREKTF